MAVDERHRAVKGVGAIVRHMALTLCALVLVTGCGLWGRETVRADAGAVRQVLDIGRAIAQTTEDPIFGDVIQIDDILVMDVGASSFAEGVDIASGRLAERGWSPVSKDARGALMKSKRWKDTSLTIQPFKTGNEYGLELPDSVAEKVRLTSGPGIYVLVVVTRVRP